jgi:hypothetical protein
MSEWQPAIFTGAHGLGAANPEVFDRAKKTVIRVRLSDARPHQPRCERVMAETKFYDIHPDDEKKVYGYIARALICEHEILTD